MSKYLSSPLRKRALSLFHNQGLYTDELAAVLSVRRPLASALVASPVRRWGPFNPFRSRTRGPGAGAPLLTPAQVEEARGLWASGVSMSELARKYNVSDNTVKHHIIGLRNGIPVSGKLGWEAALQIRAEYGLGKTTMEKLAIKHEVSTTTIHSVLHGKTYREKGPSQKADPGSFLAASVKAARARGRTLEEIAASHHITVARAGELCKSTKPGRKRA